MLHTSYFYIFLWILYDVVGIVLGSLINYYHGVDQEHYQHWEKESNEQFGICLNEFVDFPKMKVGDFTINRDGG